jgi:hypothetical protein
MKMPGRLLTDLPPMVAEPAKYLKRAPADARAMGYERPRTRGAATLTPGFDPGLRTRLESAARAALTESQRRRGALRRFGDTAAARRKLCTSLSKSACRSWPSIRNVSSISARSFADSG